MSSKPQAWFVDFIRPHSNPEAMTPLAPAIRQRDSREGSEAQGTRGHCNTIGRAYFPAVVLLDLHCITDRACLRK